MTQDPISMDTPWRRDTAEVTPLLDAWAKHAVSQAAEVTGVETPGGNGASSETMLFSMRTGVSGEAEGYVARLAPLSEMYPVFPEYDIDVQRRCMDLVRANTTVPTPEVPWCELDESWLGTPFLVMPRIEGVAPTDMPPYTFDGWVLDASPEERARVQENAARMLAGVHEVTAENADLSFLARPGHGASPLDQQLGYQRWYYEWARHDVTYPLIERAFAWLDARRPEEGPAVLNWGDSRIGNILWRATEPVAVLDWEMAAVGPREVDLAWMIHMHAFLQEMAVQLGLPGSPGFMDRAEVSRSYERFSGHQVRDLDWYEVFAALRFAIIMVRISTRSIAYGMAEKPDDPDDLIMSRRLLEELLADGG